MIKKIVPMIILFICLISSVCFAEKLTDSRGYMRNGRLEEYDRRAREASKTGFDKRGYYVNPEYRRDLENGCDPDEYAKKDADRESLYFNADGSPKPGVFATDKEIDEMMERFEKAKLEHAMTYPSLQDQQAADRARKLRAQERKQELNELIFYSFVAAFIGGVGLVCVVLIMQKTSEYQARKKNCCYSI